MRNSISEVLPKQNRRDSSAVAGHVLRQSPSSAPVAAGVIARIKTARLILDEMVAAGVELRPVSPSTRMGLCPFHPDHTPSLWVDPQSGLWGCNRPDCSAAGTHDVINFRAMCRGISNAAAIKQLAVEFLQSRE